MDYTKYICDGDKIVYEYIKHSNGTISRDGFYHEYYDDNKTIIKVDKNYSYCQHFGVEKNGDYKKYYYDPVNNIHQLITRRHYFLGGLHGEYYKWWPNGNLRKQCKYVYNDKVGKVKSYYESGNKKIVYTCDDKGLIQGRYIEYFDKDEPTIKYEADYSNNHRVGKSYKYYPDGTLYIEYNHEYYDDGGISNKYNEDNLHGELTKYYPSGLIKSIKYYVDGWKSGEHTKYRDDVNNTRSSKWVYYKGLRGDESTEYDNYGNEVCCGYCYNCYNRE